MLQVVRVPGPSGVRFLYLREGCVAALRRQDRVTECVVRRLPDHDGRVLVSVEGHDERVAVADLVEAA